MVALYVGCHLIALINLIILSRKFDWCFNEHFLIYLLSNIWIELIEYPTIGFRPFPKNSEEVEKYKIEEFLARDKEKSNIKRFSWGNIVFPAATRIFAKTIGTDLVSVQPLAEPSGIFHYLDMSYIIPETNSLLIDNNL